MARRKRKATDPVLQAKLKDFDRFVRQRQEDDLKGVLSTAEGRRTLIWIIYGVCLLEMGGIDATGEALIHMNGRRAVGRELMARAQELHPGALATAMSDEFTDRAKFEQFKTAILIESTEDVEESDLNGGSDTD